MKPLRQIINPPRLRRLLTTRASSPTAQPSRAPATLFSPPAEAALPRQHHQAPAPQQQRTQHAGLSIPALITTTVTQSRARKLTPATRLSSRLATNSWKPTTTTTAGFLAKMSTINSTTNQPTPQPASTSPTHASTPPSAGTNHTAAADASPPQPADDDQPPPDDNHHPATAGTSGATTSSPLPALPAPGSTDSSSGSTTTILEVDGKAVALDHLGPMVVGRDGTVSRISNWTELSDIERRNTLRILGKRNQVRLAALRGEDGAGGKAV